MRQRAQRELPVHPRRVARHSAPAPQPTVQPRVCGSGVRAGTTGQTDQVPAGLATCGLSDRRIFKCCWGGGCTR